MTLYFSHLNVWQYVTPRALTSFQPTPAWDPLILTKSPGFHYYWWSFQVSDTWWCSLYPDSPADEATQQKLWPSPRLPKFVLQALLRHEHLAIWRKDKGPPWWELTPLLTWQYYVHLLFLNYICKLGDRAEWGLYGDELIFNFLWAL